MPEINHDQILGETPIDQEDVNNVKTRILELLSQNDEHDFSWKSILRHLGFKKLDRNVTTAVSQLIHEGKVGQWEDPEGEEERDRFWVITDQGDDDK